MPDTLIEFTVKLSRSGKQFSTLSNISILESGLSAGITLPFGCANGSCGDCKARVVAGQARKIKFHDYTLTESEKVTGVCLLCSYTADSDLLVEVSEASSVEDIPFQKNRGKLCHLEETSDIFIARFKLTRGKALRYLPGQYAIITAPNRTQCILPIANCPCESSYLEFHLPKDNELAIDTIKPLDRVSIDGPVGQFTLDELKSPQENSTHIVGRPVLFVVTGKKFGSIKPLIEHILSLEVELPCGLVWITDSPEIPYRHNLCRSWADAFEQFSYFTLNSIDAIGDTLSQSWSTNCGNAQTYVSTDTEHHNACISALQTAGVAPDLITFDNVNRDTQVHT